MSAETSAIFVRLLRDEDKGGVLATSIGSLRRGELNDRLFIVQSESLRQVPGAPFAYWIGERIRRLYRMLPPFEAEGRTVKSGLCTGDDFRFIRTWWEVPTDHILDAGRGPCWQSDPEAFRTWCRNRTGEGRFWVSLAKGGEYSPYFADIQLVVNWRRDGCEVRAGAESGSLPGARPQNTDRYFDPGLSYVARTSLRICASPLAAGCIFAHVGPAILPALSQVDVALARFNSYTAEAFIAPYHARGTEGDDQTKKYEVGLLQLVPWPNNADTDEREAARAVMVSFQRRAFLDETGRSFRVPLFGDNPTEAIVDAILRVERAVAEAYGLSLADSFTTACSEAATPDNIRADVRNGVRVGLDWPDRAQQALEVLSYCLGCSFGRWDIRFALKECSEPSPVDPFAPLPVCPPGMLTDHEGQPPRNGPSDYPLRVSSDGILVDDPGHSADVMRGINESLSRIHPERGEAAIRDIVDLAGSSENEPRLWFRSRFFDYHRKRYTRSGRKAPIYWQLATPAASYAVWLYYHRFTADTFYKVFNDYVKPKLDHEQRKLDGLRVEAGPEPTRSQRDKIAEQEMFVGELKAFAEEIERTAPLWNPDLNDGVIINFAPLWRLVPQHKAWQKECKECWDSLVAGDYDWAHLAMHLWPERVVPKCRADASLAIAHGLEDVFWEQNEKDKWVAKTEPDEGWGAVIERLVAERAKPAVKAALKSLLEAPAAAGNGKVRKRAARGRSRS